MEKGIITKINFAQKRRILQDHQIRTPINLVIGDIQFLKSVELSNFPNISQLIISKIQRLYLSTDNIRYFIYNTDIFEGKVEVSIFHG